MINASDSKLPSITGVLLLDCWEPDWHCIDTHPHQTQQFYQNVLDNSDLSGVVCAINCLSLASIDLEDCSFVNTLRIYAWDRARRDQYRTRCSDLVANVMSNTNWANNQVSRLLHNRVLNNDHSIQLRTERDFYTHWRFVLDRQVNDWLVLGQHWNLCVESGSLGLSTLSRISMALGVNFYATDHSFLKQDGTRAEWRDFLNDSHYWCHVQDWGYRLMPCTHNPVVSQYITYM